MFDRFNTELIALTTDAPGKNLRIARRLGLKMPILSDRKGEVLKRLGMWDARWRIAAYGYYLLDGNLRVIARQRGYWDVDEESVTDLLGKSPAVASDAG